MCRNQKHEEHFQFPVKPCVMPPYHCLGGVGVSSIIYLLLSPCSHLLSTNHTLGAILNTFYTLTTLLSWGPSTGIHILQRRTLRHRKVKQFLSDRARWPGAPGPAFWAPPDSGLALTLQRPHESASPDFSPVLAALSASTASPGDRRRGTGAGPCRKCCRTGPAQSRAPQV